MTAWRLFRWAGLAGVISGLLAIGTDFLFWVSFRDQPTRVSAASGSWSLLLFISFVAAFLGLLALFGLYARQVRESGGFGLMAFLVAAIGLVLNMGFLWSGLFLVPALTEAAPDFLDATDSGPQGGVAVGFISTAVVFALGWTLIAIVTLRTRLFPAAPAWLLIAGAVFSLVAAIAGFPFGATLFGLALAWLGWLLWRDDLDGNHVAEA